MKQIFTPFLFACAFTAQAQYTNLVPGDPQGDVDAFVIEYDISAIGYKIDVAKDSIEFKITTYDTVSLSKSLGFAFGIDSNQVAGDGHKWQGGISATNPSFKYDNYLAVYKPGSAATWTAKVGSPSSMQDISSKVSLSNPDKATFIIRMPLSYLDKNAKFNIVVGMGDESLADPALMYTIREAVPNSGSSTIAVQTPNNVTDIDKNSALVVYPNPASRTLRVILPVSYSHGTKYSIISLTGQLVKEGDLPASGDIDISSFSKGHYLLQVGAGSQAYRSKFSVQ